MTVIEARGRGGQLLERVRSEAAEITVGRGFDNDLILEDEFVSPSHLRLTVVDGGWLVHDCDSLNGVRRSSRRTVVQSGDTIRIGHTTLHVYDRDHPVSEAIALGSAESRLLAMGNHFVWPLVLVLMLVVTILIEYWRSYTKFGMFNINDLLVGSVTGVLLFAGIWALVSRLVRHKAGFFAHLTFWSLFGTATFATSFVASWIGFNTNSAAAERLIELALTTILMGLAFWASLFLATSLRGRFRVMAAGALALAFAAIPVIGDLSFGSRFHSYPQYYSRLHSPGLLWSRPQSEPDLSQSLPELFERADSEAEKEVGRSAMSLGELLRGH